MNREPLVAGFNPAAGFRIGDSQLVGLAPGAVVAAAVLHHAPLDVSTTNWAWFTSPMSNLEIGMGCAQFTLGADIGVHAGALAANGRPKNSADVVM